MTTDEFVENVNAIDNRDECESVVAPTGVVLLRKCGDLVAVLGRHDIEWNFVSATSAFTIPTKILKLMVELAESREENNRYVILNGKPFLLEGKISTRAFLIIDNSLSFATVSIDDLADFAYTKEELVQLKNTLPKKLQDAVDLLTVTVGEAKKVLKHDHME